MNTPSQSSLQKSRTPPKLRPSPRNSSQEGTPFNASNLSGMRVISSPILRAGGPPAAAARALELNGRESVSSTSSPPRIGLSGMNPPRGSVPSVVTTAAGKRGNPVPPVVVRASPPPSAAATAPTISAAATALAATSSVPPVAVAATRSTGTSQRPAVVDRAGPAREIEIQRNRLDEDKVVSKKVPATESSLASPRTRPSPPKARAVPLPDSPSSPCAGRRSNLRPTHAFHLAANTDVPLSQTAHLSHLPNEFAEVNREATKLGITVISLAGQVEGAIAPTSEFRRQPAVEPAASPPPPPSNISKPMRFGDDDSDEMSDATAHTSTRGPDAAAHLRRESNDAGQKSSAVQCALEDDVVTCVVQVVCSERHFCDDPNFDPIALVRITRCSLQRTTVGRLLDLVHKSLNFYSTRRGVIRLFSHENVDGLCQSSMTHCVVLHPESMPVAAFVNTRVFQYRKPSEDRLVVLRWVEDGVVPGASATTPSRAAPRAETVVRPPDAKAPMLSRATETCTSSPEVPSSGVVFRGFRATRMHEGPQFLGSNWTALAGSMTSSGVHLPATDVAVAPPPPVADVPHGGPQRGAIPQFQVPSRSASSASHHSTPAVSPVRRTVDFSAVAAAGASSAADIPGVDGVYSVRERVALLERKTEAAHERETVPYRPPQSDAVDVSHLHDILPSSLSAIVIDGVTFVPKTHKEAKLAQEIAVLRDALQAERGGSDGMLSR